MNKKKRNIFFFIEFFRKSFCIYIAIKDEQNHLIFMNIIHFKSSQHYSIHYYYLINIINDKIKQLYIHIFSYNSLNDIFSVIFVFFYKKKKNKNTLFLIQIVFFMQFRIPSFCYILMTDNSIPQMCFSKALVLRLNKLRRNIYSTLFTILRLRDFALDKR